MKINYKREFKQARTDAYPSAGDQLGAILKGFQALLDQGIELPQETKDMIHRVNLVKQAIPKEQET